MEELKDFAKLNLDDDGEDAVVGHGQASGQDVAVIIPSNEIEFEEVCRRRWGDYKEAKRTLECRVHTLLTWESFYNLMEDINVKFAEARKTDKPRVFEQSRVFGTKQNYAKSGAKRAKDRVEANNLPSRYNIVSVCANEQFAAVLCNTVFGPLPSPSGKLWVCSTANLESSSWRDTGVYLEEFQAGYVHNDVLYTVTSKSIEIYTLPRADHVYHLDVWETHSVLLADNVNVIRATAYPKSQGLVPTHQKLEGLVVIVTRSRGFLVWLRINKTLILLHYENTAGKSEQYTTVSIYMDTVAFGTTDGYVEIWQVKEPSTETPPRFVMLSRKHWFEPVTSSSTGKVITPTPNQPILCVELCGVKLAMSTEKDFVMVDNKSKSGILCVLPDVATVASVKIFGDLICVLERDGGIMISQFGSGRTFCNTIDSVSHATESCVVGQQWAFFCGNMAGALMPDGALAVLNQDSMKNH